MPMERFGIAKIREERQEWEVVATSREEELKKALELLMKKITEENERGIETFENASTALMALRDLRCHKKEDVSIIPRHFLCPLSSKLMIDPVVIASGETYDRPYIQARLNTGNLTCPLTQEVLSHSILTPNLLVRRMISEWHETHGIESPCVNIQPAPEQDILWLDSLLKQLSGPSISEMKKAAKDIRLLTKSLSSFRVLLGERSEAIPQLLSVLSLPEIDQHLEIKENIVTTILNLSIYDGNKEIVGENSLAIPLLIEALKTGTMESRGNAAAALFTLSAIDSNKLKIGEMGAMKPLLDLLEQGSQMAKKDTASAIFNLCKVSVNKENAVRVGAVRVMLKNIMDQSLVDESLAILAMFAGYQEAVEEVGTIGGVPCLLSIIRESTSEKNRENSAAILYSICFIDRKMLRVIREEENRNKTISQLEQTGTSRARRKATGILERLNRKTYLDALSPSG